MRDTILEVDAADADAALAALEAAPSVEEAYLNGAFVHANIGERSAADADVSGVLAAAGLAGSLVTPVEPTLEDVFVHLVGEQRRRDGR